MRRLPLAALAALASCAADDFHLCKMNVTVSNRFDRQSEPDKDRELDYCFVSVKEGEVRVRARRPDRRWEVHARGACEAARIRDLAGRTFDVTIDVEFEGRPYLERVPGRIVFGRYEPGGLNNYIEGTISGETGDGRLNGRFLAEASGR